MKTGKDFIIFPLDVSTEAAARQLVGMLHRDVGMFKIGLELFVRCGPSLVQWVADHGTAAIFLDLKLHDIPITVERAMQGIADLKVALTTVHCGESQAMLGAAVRGGGGKVGVLGVTVLTSVSGAQLRAVGYQDHLADDTQRLVLLKAAMARDAGCAGVVCSGHEVAAIKARMGQSFLAVTPGIRPDWTSGVKKDDQHRVVTPAAAVTRGADYLVIGRPIRDAADPAAAARRIAAEIDKALEAGTVNRD
ncbi:MAG: orotidine-5'-phosphate decarboxylase [Desulfatitalea sp.]|nr:orotidine-5'-phosphate decarboxylase [Desulfatitalea sp.]